MDAGRFDGLARSLARLRTRRAAVRFAAGALAALGVTKADATDAAPRGKKKCKHGRTPCGNTCCPKGKICAGKNCVTGQANCPNGADSCSATDTVACTNDTNCACYHRLEGGTRCVQFLLPIGACDQCKTDADCVALGFPPGSSCIQDFGVNCTTCNDNKKGYCGEPCGFVPPPAPIHGQTRSAGPHG
jgi:hypothetical protein